MTTTFNEIELNSIVKNRILTRIKKIDSPKGIEGECWLFKGGKDKYKYGRINVRKRKENYCRHFYVHRLSYVYFKGSIKDNTEIHHTCENRPCCNPEHLEAKSRKDNMRIRWDSKSPEGIQVELF